MRSRSRAERDVGAVTAEFVVVLPAILIVLALCMGGIQAAAVQVRLQAAAAAASRSIARDDAAGARRIIAAMAPHSVIAHSRRGDLVCVTVTQPLAAIPAVVVSASGCAFPVGQ